MMRSMLLGVVAGARSLTPLALLSLAARAGAKGPSATRAGATRSSGTRSRVTGPAFLRRTLARPAIVTGATALAAGELWGDKLRSAPDRIVPAGMAARVISGSIAGAAVAPRGRRAAGALLGAGTAVVAAHLTFRARMRAMRRYGQTSTGLVEDALALGLARLVIQSRRS